MPKSTEEHLDEAVVAAAKHARAASGGRATGMQIDFQVSGELPYRLFVPDETHPLIGLARTEPGPEETPDLSSSVTQSQAKG